MQACKTLDKTHREESIQNHAMRPTDGRINRDWKVTTYIDVLKLNNKNKLRTEMKNQDNWKACIEAVSQWYSFLNVLCKYAARLQEKSRAEICFQ